MTALTQEQVLEQVAALTEAEVLKAYSGRDGSPSLVAAWLKPEYPSLGLKELRKAVALFGGTVEGGVTGRNACYSIDAPPGKVWAAADVHALAVYWRTDEKDYRTASIK